MKLFIASILLVFCFGLQSCKDDDYSRELPLNTQHKFPYALSEFYKLNWKTPTNFDVFDANTMQMLYTENWIYKESDTLIRDELYSVVEKCHITRLCTKLCRTKAGWGMLWDTTSLSLSHSG